MTSIDVPHLPKTSCLSKSLSNLKISTPFESTAEFTRVVSGLNRLESLDIHCDFDDFSVGPLEATVVFPSCLRTLLARGSDVSCSSLFRLLRVENNPGPEPEGLRQLFVFMERTDNLEVMDELVTSLTNFLAAFLPGDAAFQKVSYSLEQQSGSSQGLFIEGTGKSSYVFLTGMDRRRIQIDREKFDFGIQLLSCLSGRSTLSLSINAEFTTQHLATFQFWSQAIAYFPTVVWMTTKSESIVPFIRSLLPSSPEAVPLPKLECVDLSRVRFASAAEIRALQYTMQSRANVGKKLRCLRLAGCTGVDLSKFGMPVESYVLLPVSSEVF